MASFNDSYDPMGNPGTGMPSIFVAARKAGADYAKQSADMERAAFDAKHKLEREERQDLLDDDVRARELALKRMELMAPGGPLTQIARRSAALANELGKPFNVPKYSEETVEGAAPAPAAVEATSPPPPAAAEPKPPAAQAAAFLQGAPAAPIEDPGDRLQGPRLGTTEPIADPRWEAAHAAAETAKEVERLHDPMARRQGPMPGTTDPIPDIAWDAAHATQPAPQQLGPDGLPIAQQAAPIAQQAAPPPPVAMNDDNLLPLAPQGPMTRHLYQTVNGQRYEIPTADDASAVSTMEPEYQKMYSDLMNTGRYSAKEALAAVQSERRTDVGEGGRNTRAAATLAQQKATQLTVEQKRKQWEEKLAQDRTLAADRNRTRIVAASLSAAGGAQRGTLAPPNPKTHMQWLSNFKNAESEGRIKQAVQIRENLDRIAGEVEEGKPPNALLETTMIHSLGVASASMGASGGRLTNQIANDVKHATGPLMELQNNLYRIANGGENDPEVIRVRREAAARLREIGYANGVNEFRGLDRRAGRGSAYGRIDPNLAPIIQDAMLGTAINLGIRPEDLDPGQIDTGPAPGVPAAPAPHRPRSRPGAGAPQGGAPARPPMKVKGPDGVERIYKFDPATGKYHP